MKRWFIWLGLALVLFGCGGDKNDVAEEDVVDPEIRLLIAQLATTDIESAQFISKDLSRRGASVVPALIESLQDSDKNVRFWVVMILRDIGDSAKSAVPHLVKMLNDEDVGVRLEVAIALGRLGDETVVPFLVKKIEAGDLYEYAEWAPVQALGELGGIEAVSFLIDLLRTHSNLLVRRSAADALGKIGNPVAVPALREALKDESSGVRFSAAQALMQFNLE